MTHVWVFLECECLVHFHPTSIISDHRPHTSIYLYLCWRLSIMPEYAEHFVVLFLCRKNMLKFKKSIVFHLSLLPQIIFGKIYKIEPKIYFGWKASKQERLLLLLIFCPFDKAKDASAGEQSGQKNIVIRIPDIHPTLKM